MADDDLDLDELEQVLNEAEAKYVNNAGRSSGVRAETDAATSSAKPGRQKELASERYTHNTITVPRDYMHS